MGKETFIIDKDENKILKIFENAKLEEENIKTSKTGEKYFLAKSSFNNVESSNKRYSPFYGYKVYNLETLDIINIGMKRDIGIGFSELIEKNGNVFVRMTAQSSIAYFSLPTTNEEIYNSEEKDVKDYYINIETNDELSEEEFSKL